MQSHALSKGIVKKKRTKNYLLLFLFLLEASLGYSQNVTLHLKDESIEKAFRAIESQTDYNFVYSTETIRNAKPVTVDLAAVSIDEALVRLFSGQPLHFAIEDHQVIVKREEKTNDNPVSDVAGRVVDESGNPLQGASISVKGSSKGTNTDALGKFTLRSISPDAVLTCSMVGYQSIEIPLNGRASLLIRMSISVTALDETIIKGYYNTTRRLNTGSVDKVTAEEINRQPVSNVLAAIEGRVPGLLITQENGLPGSNFSVLIRGQNSIQSGTSPLYIVDGVPFLNDADVLTQRSGINASNPLNSINPADIESIEVLKDADATAIYGSRGANGVILITTRKAKTGATSVDVNYYQGFGRVTHMMPYMNTQQYLQMRHEAFRNDNVTPTSFKAYDFLVWDSTRYTDLKKLLIGNTAITNNMNLRLSGGNAATHFTIGAGYNRQTTVFPGNTSDRRASVDFNLTHALPDKKFSMALATSYSDELSSLFNLDLTQFINLPPTIPNLYDSSGRLNWSSGGFNFYNPLAVTMQTYKVGSGRLTANLNLNFALSPKINFKTNLGYNDVHTDENTRFPIASQDPVFAPTGSAFFGTSTFKNWIIEPQGEFHTKAGKKGKLEFLLGTSFQENRIGRIALTASGYNNDRLLESASGASSVTATNSNVLYRYNALFSRVNYSYHDKYLLNLTGRRDGSSRFGPGKQFANFGAAGAAWIFTKEKWASTHLAFLSFGKLRGSYGITGNDLIGDYQYLDAYKPALYPYQDDPSLTPQKLFNPDYSWEQIRKLDLALELNFIRDRLSIEVDYFQNKSRNQIINYSLPGQAGFASVLQNFPGIVQNRGLEIQLGGTVIKTAGFSLHSALQLTKSSNQLLAFPGLAASSYAKRYTLGKPLDGRIGYLFAGVDPQTGLYEFWDANKIKTASPSLPDYTYLGSTDPDFYGGWSNDLVFGNWQLNFLFEFRKQLGADPVFSHTDRAGTIKNQPAVVLQRWMQPGDYGPYQRFTQSFGAPASAAVNAFNSNAYFTDASFVRLKTLSLSYGLPSSAMKKMKMQSARLYLEGQNLLLITKYKGNDPESQNTLTLPPLRVIAAGVQITF